MPIHKRGIGEPTTSTLERLSDYFKVSVAWIRGDSPMSYEDEQQYYDILPMFEKDYIERKKTIAALMKTAQCLDLTRITALKARADELYNDFLEELAELGDAYDEIGPLP